MKLVYLFRHGQTEDNSNRIIQGQSDSLLTPEGINSIKKRAKKISDITFNEIYCSPLGRARSSLDILLKELKQNTNVAYLDELMEIDFGRYTKKNINEIIDIIKTHKKNTAKPYPGGESGDMLKERVIRFMNEFVIKNDGKYFLVMTHYGVIETIIQHYNNLSSEEIRSKKDTIIRLSLNRNNVDVSFEE
ncbi:MAG TPA: histidine phosphatase family protein [Nitrospinota bacterium]|jgi:broad specificity phosphatase PhoE|nr:histidine phosphatase family protein [Nitrospinota bacterium]